MWEPSENLKIARANFCQTFFTPRALTRRRTILSARDNARARLTSDTRWRGNDVVDERDDTSTR
jgi:hypothetical protein